MFQPAKDETHEVSGGERSSVSEQHRLPRISGGSPEK